MNDLNSVCLIGNLTRDAEVSYSQSGSAVGKFSIAVNRSRKQGDRWEDEVSYFDVTLFGKSAEGLKKFLVKGKKVAVKGSLKQDRWKDKESGQARSRVVILAEGVELLGGNPNGERQQESVPQYEGGTAEAGGFQEDIPF